MALTRSLSTQPKYFNSETKAGLPSQLSPFEYIVLGSRFNKILLFTEVDKWKRH